MEQILLSRTLLLEVADCTDIMMGFSSYLGEMSVGKYLVFLQLNLFVAQGLPCVILFWNLHKQLMTSIRHCCHTISRKRLKKDNNFGNFGNH